VNKNLRWKIVLIVSVVALSVWSFYPPSQKVNLGLDLRGGVHLIMRVQTEAALRIETDTAAERLREDLGVAGLEYTNLEVTSPTEFVVEGVQDDQAFRQVAVEADTVFARSPGAGSYTYTMRPNIATQLREEAVTQAQQTIERRVNELGVAEPIVARQGADDQILVQLPGVTDVDRAKEVIGRTALLELKLVEQGPFLSEEAAMQAVGDVVPPDMEIVSGSEDVAATGGGTPGTVYYIVRRVAPVTGRDLRTSRPTLDENNLPAVSFTFNQDGAQRFGQFTEQNIGRGLAVMLDNRVFTAPTIQSRIADEGRITGSFTQQEAQDLSLVLRTGALPAPMDVLEERTVGPTLGRESIRAGVTASLGGLTLVLIFILLYYKRTGLNAVVSILVNLSILLGMMAYLGATMTLPGIAGFILTIGIGVDSNVLIFERIKEELATAKGVRAAVNSGFDRVWWTIVDTHVASLISAMFLFQFGTGPIRGFATTLTIGLLANVFTAVFVSRTMFELVLSRRQQQAQALSI
jgi:preprotein translocase subunit SecD